MEYCDICQQPMKKTAWPDEAWGRIYQMIEYSCENPDCSEDLLLEKDEDEDDEH